MTRNLAALTVWAILASGTLADPQDFDPPDTRPSQEPSPLAEPPPPEPELPKAELIDELTKRLAGGEDPANLVALLRSVNRFVWKHTDAGNPYPRDRYFPVHPLLVGDYSPPLAQRLAAEGFFAVPVKVHLRVDAIHSEDGKLVLRGRITWRQRSLQEYFDSSDRSRRVKLRRAIAVLKKELRELAKTGGKAVPGKPQKRGDESDEEIRKLLRELVRHALGEAPGEVEPENVTALKELQLEEAQKEVTAIYAAARERKEYSETAHLTAYVIPEPDQELDVSRLARAKRLKLHGVVSDGFIGRPFLMTDKPFLRRLVMVARLVDLK